MLTFSCRSDFLKFKYEYFAAYIFGDLLHSLAVKKLLIEDVPLHDISEDIFLGVGKWLRELHFRRTMLTFVPTKSFLVSDSYFFFKVSVGLCLCPSTKKGD